MHGIAPLPNGESIGIVDVRDELKLKVKDIFRGMNWPEGQVINF